MATLSIIVRASTCFNWRIRSESTPQMRKSTSQPRQEGELPVALVASIYLNGITFYNCIRACLIRRNMSLFSKIEALDQEVRSYSDVPQRSLTRPQVAFTQQGGPQARELGGHLICIDTCARAFGAHPSIIPCERGGPLPSEYQIKSRRGEAVSKPSDEPPCPQALRVL